MSEQTTNPTAGVEQEPSSVEDRLVAFYTKTPRRTTPTEPTAPRAAAPAQQQNAPAQPAAEAAEQPEATPESGDLTPEDIPDDDIDTPAPSELDAFEIVHNGQQHRLSREETIRYAQQGFDYTQKTQALAESSKQVAERLQRIAAVEQVLPQLEQAKAQAMALHSQVQRYQGVDWVKLATEDPLEYSKVRAHYDATNQAYQQATGQFQQLSGAVKEQQGIVRAQILQAEARKLPERIPEWKDPEKYKQGVNDLRQYLLSEGASEAEIDGLTSSTAVSIAWKAMQYERLRKSKAEKVGQLRTAPPVTKPGAAQSPQSASQRDVQSARANLKKTGDWRDAAALLAKIK